MMPPFSCWPTASNGSAPLPNAFFFGTSGITTMCSPTPSRFRRITPSTSQDPYGFRFVLKREVYFTWVQTCFTEFPKITSFNSSHVRKPFPPHFSLIPGNSPRPGRVCRDMRPTTEEAPCCSVANIGGRTYTLLLPAIPRFTEASCCLRGCSLGRYALTTWLVDSSKIFHLPGL